MNEMAGRIFMTVVAAGLVPMAYYLVKRKLENPDAGPHWGGLIAVSCLAFLFFLFAVLAWVGAIVGEQRETVDAELVSVASDGVGRSDDEDMVFMWTLTCRWRHPVSGEMITTTSDTFYGRQLFYNRSTIAVIIDPRVDDGAGIVDLQYVSNENRNGIQLVHVKDVAAALAAADKKMETRRNTRAFRLLSGPLDFYHAHTVAIHIIATFGPIILFLGAILWWWMGKLHERRVIRSFERAIHAQIEGKKWTFTLQPGAEGIFKVGDTEYPGGFSSFAGVTYGRNWKALLWTHGVTRQRYRSDEEKRVSTAHTLRWQTEKGFTNEPFLLVVSLPSYFPGELGTALQQETRINGNIGFGIADKPAYLLSRYAEILFADNGERYLPRTSATRVTHPYQESTYIIVAASVERMAQARDYVIPALHKARQAQAWDGGILITHNSTIVGTHGPMLFPADIELIAKFGLSIAEEADMMNRK